MTGIGYAIGWLVLFVILLVIELMTLGLTTIWFCVGAFIAMIAAVLKVNFIVQIILFTVISAVLMLALRPWAVKYINKRTVKTNVDSLIGKTARVTVSIDNSMETGSAMLNGLEWTARSENDKTKIPEGSMVEVISVSGVKLIVRPKEDANTKE